MRQPNKVGGGAKTNEVGLHFEQTTDLREAILNEEHFSAFGDRIYKDGHEVGRLFQKHSLYKNLLSVGGIDFKTILSKQLLPDDAILVGDTLYIIEKKFQSGAGSVDEKLQTCDFKKKQYTKLLAPLGIKVEYYYFLSDWFRQDCYRDVRDYIISVGCRYYFDEIPLKDIGL